MADILKLVDDNAQDLIRIADAIWDYSELGFRETQSAKIQADYLEEQGFTVTRGREEFPRRLWRSGGGPPIHRLLG